MKFIPFALIVYFLYSICALTAQDMKPSSLFRKIPNIKLGVSGTVQKYVMIMNDNFIMVGSLISGWYKLEPDPSWFGNRANEPNNPTWTNQNWLKSRFHFSFAEYSNPRNMGFGILRVMNDDLVQPNRGWWHVYHYLLFRLTLHTS